MTDPHAKTGEPPWGKWEVLLNEAAYKVKRIHVNPGARLSYQRHQKRAEHWTVLCGTASVLLDGAEVKLEAGQSIDIPMGASHRISNTGKDAMIFLEVQTGTYFGEDDIERLEDDYGRKGSKV